MKKILLSTLLVVGLFAFGLAPKAQAAEFKGGTSYSLGSDEKIETNLYVGAQSIVISGTVEGDVIVAARSVEIDGTVNGNVEGVAENITISGKVTGSVRVAASSVTVSGNVLGDVISASAQFTESGKASINGVLVVYAGQVDINGIVHNDLRASAAVLNIGGEVDGNGFVNVNQMTIGGNGKIGGNLAYTASAKLSPAEQQKVEGSLEYKEVSKSRYGTAPSLQDKVIAQAVFRAYMFVALGVIALLALWLLPVASKKVSDVALGTNLYRNFLVGFLVLIVLPIGGIVLLLTIFGIPLAFMLGGFYAMLLSLSALPVAWFVGTKIFSGANQKKVGKYYTMLSGLLVVEVAFGILKLVPVVGSLASFIVVCWGFGVLLRSLWEMTHGVTVAKKQEAVESVK